MSVVSLCNADVINDSPTTFPQQLYCPPYPTTRSTCRSAGVSIAHGGQMRLNLWRARCIANTVRHARLSSQGRCGHCPIGRRLSYVTGET